MARSEGRNLGRPSTCAGRRIAGLPPFAEGVSAKLELVQRISKAWDGPILQPRIDTNEHEFSMFIRVDSWLKGQPPP